MSRFSAAESGQISAEKEMDLPHAWRVREQDFIAGRGIPPLATEVSSLPSRAEAQRSSDRSPGGSSQSVSYCKNADLQGVHRESIQQKTRTHRIERRVGQCSRNDVDRGARTCRRIRRWRRRLGWRWSRGFRGQRKRRQLRWWRWLGGRRRWLRWQRRNWQQRQWGRQHRSGQSGQCRHQRQRRGQHERWTG
jgi:hypothetical protein